MSYKRLSLLIVSQVLILLLLFFLGYKYYFTGESAFLIAFLFAAVYFIYTLKNFIKELLKIKKDKEDGPCEDILIFCNYKVLYKGIEHDNNLPPTPVATFRAVDEIKYISLMGDYSNISLTEGRKYKVKYYENSEIIISISSLIN